MPSRSVREISVGIVAAACDSSTYQDELLDGAFQSCSIAQKDKPLLVELVNGTLRWRGQLDWILRKLYHGNLDKTDVSLRSILEVSLYQLRFLDRVPKYAAVSEGVEMAKQFGGKRWGNLVNGILRNYLREEGNIRYPDREDDLVLALSVQYSHPKWMIERWLRQFGAKDTIRFCEFNNSRPEIAMRVNTSLTTTERLIADLAVLGVEGTPSLYFADFVKTARLGDLTENSAFQEGCFSIQDESTALAVQLLEPTEADLVLDMCAAPGGKTCYIAQLMHDKGKVIAVDINCERIKLLKGNTRRLRLKSIVPLVANAARLVLPGITKIILDVPCSGLGVLSKRSDLRWKRKAQDVKKIVHLQKALLRNAGRLIGQGGTIVYSTCSLEPEETEGVIEAFLVKNPEFTIDRRSTVIDGTFRTREGYYKSLPFEHHMDGAFAVRLVRQR